MGANQENSAALRTFRILETLAKSSRPLSLTEIVDQIDLPKQTIHRILTQMQESWLITRSPGSRNYTCSSRVNRFACNVMLNSGATAARNAILRDLVEQIGETCNITMLSGTEIVYVDRVETKWALRVHLQAIGHPILGDELYAPPEVFARAPRLLLHAAFLAFFHPSTATEPRVESGAPF